MSLKRKAGQISKGDVSAFAAAQAWREKQQDLAGSDNEAAEGSAECSSSDAEPSVFREQVDHEGYDSTHEDEYDIQETRTQIRPVFQFSTFRPTQGNPIVRKDPNTCAYALRQNDTVCFVGHYELHNLSGVVAVYGATVTAGNHVQVYAPATHALPIIVCMTATATIEIRKSVSHIHALGRTSPLFRRIWSQPSKEGKDTGSTQKDSTYNMISYSQDDPRPLQPVVTPPDWKVTMYDKLRPDGAKPKQIMVIGRKDSGKSTFCRLLTNHFLTRDAANLSAPGTEPSNTCTVCWLDLDPGQSEFSPAGQVSLVQLTAPILGPPFTHAYNETFTSNPMVHAHSIGATSPIDDPEYYLDCVQDLQARYRRILQDYPTCPLIINCPGWSRKGFGFEMVLQLLQRLTRTDVVLLGQTGMQPGRDPLLGITRFDNVHRLGEVNPSGLLPMRTAAELREMQAISYMHAEGSQWTPTPIEHQESWFLAYDGDQPDILGIATQIDHPRKGDLLSIVLDQWIVALCVVSDDTEVLKALSEVQRTDAEGLPYWPTIKSKSSYRPSIADSNVVGWAYVASIKEHSRTIELKTPLSQLGRKQALERTGWGAPRLVLMRGQTDPPGWLYLEETYAESSKKRNELASGEHKIAGIAQNGQDKARDYVNDVEIDVSSLPEVYDVGAEQCGEGSKDYVRKTSRGQAASAGSRQWVQRPRIVRPR